MPRLISKAAFSDKVGVSRSAITQAAKEGGALFGAASGKEIDLNTDSCKFYLFKKKLPLEKLISLGYEDSIYSEYEDYHNSDTKPKAQAVKKPAAKKQANQHTDRQPFSIPSNDIAPRVGFHDKRDLVDFYGNKTLNQIVKEFGTDEAFIKFASSLKTLSEIEIKKLDIAKKRGQVIDRDLVRRFIFGAIESGNLRLLNDLPGSAARHIVNEFKAGKAIESLETDLKDMISLILNDAKINAQRSLEMIKA